MWDLLKVIIRHFSFWENFIWTHPLQLWINHFHKHFFHKGFSAQLLLAQVFPSHLTATSSCFSPEAENFGINYINYPVFTMGKIVDIRCQYCFPYIPSLFYWCWKLNFSGLLIIQIHSSEFLMFSLSLLAEQSQLFSCANSLLGLPNDFFISYSVV